MRKVIHFFFMLSMIGAIFAQSSPEAPPVIEVRHYDIRVELDPERSFLKGEAKIEFEVLSESMSIPFHFNRKLSLIDVADEEGNRLNLSGDSFSADRTRVLSGDPFREGERRTLRFQFEGLLEPEQYAFLQVPLTDKAVIRRDGALLLSHGYWFPSHQLPLGGATATVRVQVPLGFTAVAPGELASVETIGISEVFTWESREPVSYLPVTVARYYRQSFGSESFPLTFFVTEDFEGDLQPWAEEIEQVADFMRERFGAAPVAGLTVCEVENLTQGESSARGLILLDKRLLTAPQTPVFELARRVARQWWGHSLRPKGPADAWLQDGFASFSALQYLEQQRPELYDEELSRQAVEALKYQDTAPILQGMALEEGSPRYESIVSSKGAWVLYMLGQLMGKEELDQAVSKWFAEKQGSEAAISEFVSLIERVSGEDYKWFFSQWIESIGVPEFQVDYTVHKITTGGFRMRGQVRQNLDLFRMPMDVLVETKGEDEAKNLTINGRTTSFDFETEEQPLRMELDPNGRVLMSSDRTRVSVHIALGREYQSQGEYISAMQEFEKAVALNPRNSLAHYYLAESFFQQHSYSNAANSFRDVLNGDLKPDWVETWTYIYLGKVFDVLGQRQRALAEYNKAIHTEIDYNGAQAEARKYLDAPYTRPASVLD